MENLAMSNMTALGKETMAALLNETSIASTVHATTSGIAMVIACIIGVSLLLLATFYLSLGALGFVAIGILPLSFAAAWMSSLGIVAAGSIFALLQSIAMGGVPMLKVWLVLLAIVAAAVGVYEAIAWLHSLHLEFSLGAWLHHSWHSVVAWLHGFWNSIPVHHKWKILLS